MSKRRLEQLYKTKGVALIIVILLITAFSTVLFSVARLTYSDISQVGRLEESITAQYAAESGLELGLLSYRLNHEAETSQNATSASPDSLSFDLGTNQIVPNPLTQSSYSYSSPLTSTKIWYMANQLGGFDDFGNITKDSPKIYKDQVLELDLTNFAGESLTFRWSEAKCLPSSGNDFDCYQPVPNQYFDPNLPESPSNSRTTNKPLYGVEFTLSITDDSNNTAECPDKVLPGTTKWLLSWPVTISCPVAPPLSDPIVKYKLRIKPWIGTSDVDNPSSQYYNLPYIYLAVTDSANQPIGPIDSTVTQIRAEGYYGSTKRAITVELDRASTTLSGLYDLVLGGLEGDVTVPGQ